MEEETFSDIRGQPITLGCQRHSSFCTEFTVSSPKVSIGKVLASTCSVWLLAYLLFFFTQNTAVLSSAILVTLVGMVLHIHFVKVDHESLLVIASLGIQVSSSYASGREITSFIEMGRIKDIVINEAVYMVLLWTNVIVIMGHLWDAGVKAVCPSFQHQIIYHLCVLLREPAEPDAVAGVVPLFQSSKPRLGCLVKVYRSCQEILSKVP